MTIAPTVIPADRWDYANEAGTAIKLVDGAAFQAGHAVRFRLPGQEPVVAGLGLAAVRDLASFAKFAEKDDAGTANPLAGRCDLPLHRLRLAALPDDA